MEAILPKIKYIVVGTGIVFLLVLAIILAVSGFELTDIMLALVKSGIAFTIATLFWVFYDRVLWRKRGFRLFKLLSPVPDLNGRWEGTVKRTRNDQPHKFVVEVTQTFSTISFKTFSKTSRGESLCATVLSQPSSGTFDVRSVWTTTTDKRGATSPETFHGASHWKVSESSDRKMTIEDRYFTNRNPATTGIVAVEWTSAERRNSF